MMSFRKLLGLLLVIAIFGYSAAFGLAPLVPGWFGDVLGVICIMIGAIATILALLLITPD